MSVESPDLVAMSFNTRGWSKPKQDKMNAWVYRARFNAETIAKYAPDTLGLQEYDKGMNEGVYRRYLPGMEYVTGPECVPERYNPIYWNASRLALVEQGGFWLSETPDQSSIGWGSSEERGATIALFRDLQTGRQFLHVNTHFEVYKDQARIESAKLILQRTERHRVAGLPIVVTGDFNTSHYLAPNTAYTSTPHNLFTSKRFADAYLTAHPNNPNPPNTFHNYEGPDYEVDEYGTWLIDHILHIGFEQRDFQIVRDAQEEEPKYPSDHFPVIARLCVTQ